MKTYTLLKQLMFHLSNAETDMIMRFLHDMDDIEFDQIPKLLFTKETIRVLDTYATRMIITREGINNKNERVDHVFYHIGSAIFRVMI